MIRYRGLLNRAYRKAHRQSIPCTRKSLYRTLVETGLINKDGQPTPDAIVNGFAKHGVMTPEAFRLISDDFARECHLISLRYIDPKLYFGNGLTTQYEQHRYHVDSVVQQTLRSYHKLIREDIQRFQTINQKRREFVADDPDFYGINRYATVHNTTVQALVDRVIDQTTEADAQSQYFADNLSRLPINYDADLQQYAVVWSKIIEWQVQKDGGPIDMKIAHCHFEYSCRQLLESIPSKYMRRIGLRIIQHDLMRAKRIWQTDPMNRKEIQR